jgi:hypothetical protein
MVTATIKTIKRHMYGRAVSNFSMPASCGMSYEHRA